jgi:hypothetical protein
MRKWVSSMGSTQPIDSTRAYCATRGFGITRRVGTTASLTRWCTVPSGSRRSDTAFTPRSVMAHVTSGMSPIWAVNCGPLKEPCRMGTWSVSMRFS